MEKATLGFPIYKIWQILTHFIKHKPLISEEYLFNKNVDMSNWNQLQWIKYHDPYSLRHVILCFGFF